MNKTGHFNFAENRTFLLCLDIKKQTEKDFSFETINNFWLKLPKLQSFATDNNNVIAKITKKQ